MYYGLLHYDEFLRFIFKVITGSYSHTNVLAILVTIVMIVDHVMLCCSLARGDDDMLVSQVMKNQRRAIKQRR